MLKWIRCVKCVVVWSFFCNFEWFSWVLSRGEIVSVSYEPFDSFLSYCYFILQLLHELLVHLIRASIDFWVAVFQIYKRTRNILKVQPIITNIVYKGLYSYIFTIIHYNLFFLNYCSLWTTSREKLSPMGSMSSDWKHHYSSNHNRN